MLKVGTSERRWWICPEQLGSKAGTTGLLEGKVEITRQLGGESGQPGGTVLNKQSLGGMIGPTESLGGEDGITGFLTSSLPSICLLFSLTIHPFLILPSLISDV